VAGRDTLFADTYQFAANPHANYDVMADGRFVFLKSASEGSMIVVSNWSSVVRARMATR